MSTEDEVRSREHRRMVRGLERRLSRAELKRAELRAQLLAAELGESAPATTQARERVHDLRLARAADPKAAADRRLARQLEDLQALPLGAIASHTAQVTP